MNFLSFVTTFFFILFFASSDDGGGMMMTVEAKYHFGAVLHDMISPVIFVVNRPGNRTFIRTSYRGTSIRTDGRYVNPTMSEDVYEKISERFPLATIVPINTDDEKSNFETTNRWMNTECDRLKRFHADCYVLSELKDFKYDLRTTSEVYDLVRLSFSMRTRTILRTKLSNTKKRLEAILETESPTFPITSSPTVPPLCVDRERKDCKDDCQYLGMAYGCRSLDFCDFTTKIACESRTRCEFKRGFCRIRKNKKMIKRN